MFGTGLRKPIDGMFAEIIDAMNQARQSIVAIDIPSGISGDNGTLLGSAVHATQTVTLALPKLGLFLARNAGGIAWVDVEVSTDAAGKPIILTSGKVKELLDSKQVSVIHASTSHDGDYAIGQIILTNE